MDSLLAHAAGCMQGCPRNWSTIFINWYLNSILGLSLFDPNRKKKIDIMVKLIREKQNNTPQRCLKVGGGQSQGAKGEAVVFYCNPLATKDLGASDFPGRVRK